MSDKMRLGYTADIEFELLSNGSKAWRVAVTAERDVVFRCVSQEAAQDLAVAINFGVLSTTTREVSA